MAWNERLARVLVNSAAVLATAIAVASLTAILLGVRPIIFVSGYEPEVVPRNHQRRPFVGKPYLSQKLLTVLSGAIGPRRFATA